MAVDTPARITILGAGPIGLEAGLYARYLGYDVDLFERGRVCENMLAWGHVRLFSPLAMNRTRLGVAALQAQDETWSPMPGEAMLTARELVEHYFAPLAGSDLLCDSIREHTEVLAVGREGCLKGEAIGDSARGERPFRILTRGVDGNESMHRAAVVIDATGTYGNANWLGAGGIPAIGETAAASAIEHGLPDVLDKDRKHYAARHTAVVGAGYSAATNVVALAKLARASAGTRVTWITREPPADDDHAPITRIPDDRLAERDDLARSANRLAAQDTVVHHWPGCSVVAVETAGAGETVWLRLSGKEEGWHDFDRLIANVGYRPDNSIYRELQVHECYASEGPMKLAAALLGRQSADCLDQPSCGPETLLTSEPNFYILGSKSYGRDSRFLLTTGFDQIRDLFTLIGGRANLDLYATMPAV